MDYRVVWTHGATVKLAGVADKRRNKSPLYNFNPMENLWKPPP